MKIAICDDEQLFRETLSNFLHTNECNVELYEFTHAEPLLHSNKQFDLIFLDIEMPGLNGLETAKFINKKSPNTLIIFMTSHSEYVYDAFKVHTFRFLNKPVTVKALKEVIYEAEREIMNNRKVIIKHRGETFEIPMHTIVYLEAFGDGTYIHTNTGKTFESSYQLKEWNEKLKAQSFVKIQRSYIISLKYLLKMKENQIWLEGVEEPFQISRRNMAYFKNIYLSYIKKNAHIM